MATKLFTGKYESTRNTKQITLHLPHADAELYKGLAKHEGKAFSAVVLEALRQRYNQETRITADEFCHRSGALLEPIARACIGL